MKIHTQASLYRMAFTDLKHRVFFQPAMKQHQQGVDIPGDGVQQVQVQILWQQKHIRGTPVEKWKKTHSGVVGMKDKVSFQLGKLLWKSPKSGPKLLKSWNIPVHSLPIWYCAENKADKREKKNFEFWLQVMFTVQINCNIIQSWNH